MPTSRTTGSTVCRQAPRQDADPRRDPYHILSYCQARGTNAISHAPGSWGEDNVTFDVGAGRASGKVDGCAGLLATHGDRQAVTFGGNEQVAGTDAPGRDGRRRQAENA